MIRRSLRSVVVLWLSTVSVGALEASALLALAPGDPAPRLSASDVAQGESYLANWQRSSFTVVNFWATWCPPCRMEMPVLQELSAKHGGEKLTVIGVMLDSVTDEEARKFASDLGVTYPLLRGTTELSKEWGGIGVLPTTFLVNQKGRIVRRYVGATSEQVTGLAADVNASLAGRPLEPPIPPPASAVPAARP